MAKITGNRSHAARLRGISSPLQVARVGRALFKAGKAIESEASHSITVNSTNAKGQHKRSLPGAAPNEEFGDLRRGLETTQPEPLKVIVSSNAPHAHALEFGTSKMIERPYLRPAAKKKRKELAIYIEAVVQNAIREGR